MSNLISKANHGSSDGPGGQYTDRIARVKRIGTETKWQYELYVRSAWGSDQGHYEEHGRTERRYRAASLEDLLDTGISEVRNDTEFDDKETSQLVAAIREAIFEAQDEENQ